MRHGIALLAVLAVTAGCLGGSPMAVSGSPAAIGNDALEAGGLERVAAENRTLNATVRASISGDVELQANRDVRATTPVRVYRSGDSVVAVVSTPVVKPIENQPIYRDPLATRSAAEQVNYAQSVYDVSGLEAVGERNRTVLGNESTVRTYAGTASGTDVTVRVARVRHEGDFVTVVAVEPASGGSLDLDALLGALEH